MTCQGVNLPVVFAYLLSRRLWQTTRKHRGNDLSVNTCQTHNLRHERISAEAQSERVRLAVGMAQPEIGFQTAVQLREELYLRKLLTVTTGLLIDAQDGIIGVQIRIQPFFIAPNVLGERCALLQISFSVSICPSTGTMHCKRAMNSPKWGFCF